MVPIVYGNYFIGWGTLALVNAAIAQLQGRSGLLWLFISLAFGPMATFILVLIHEKS